MAAKAREENAALAARIGRRAACTRGLAAATALTRGALSVLTTLLRRLPIARALTRAVRQWQGGLPIVFGGARRTRAAHPPRTLLSFITNLSINVYI